MTRSRRSHGASVSSSVVFAHGRGPSFGKIPAPFDRRFGVESGHSLKPP